MNIKMLKAAIAGLVLSVSGFANAGLILSDLGSGNYGIQLDPISFTLNSNQSAANRMVIEDFYTTNGTGTGTAISGWLNWSVNGGTNHQIVFETHNGFFAGTSGQIDPNDLLFNFTNDYATKGIGALSANDVITVSTNNMVFHSNTARIENSGPFTAYLLNSVTSISSNVGLTTSSVPEPSTLAIFALGIMGLASRRFKKQS